MIVIEELDRGVMMTTKSMANSISARAMATGKPIAPGIFDHGARVGELYLFLRCRRRHWFRWIPAILILAVGLIGPAIVPQNPYTMALNHALLPAGSPGHPLGTDDYGRDLLSRLISGARTSVWLGATVVVCAGAFGTLVGAATGYFGGLVDSVVMRLADALLAFPLAVAALFVAALLGPGTGNLILTLTLLGWVGYARLARSLVLRVKSERFVEAARAVGAGSGRILFRHILPNIAGPLASYAALHIGSVILICAELGFLGFGVQPPTPDWGLMLNEGRAYLRVAPQLAIFPTLAITLAVMSFQGLARAWNGRNHSERC